MNSPRPALPLHSPCIRGALRALLALALTGLSALATAAAATTLVAPADRFVRSETADPEAATKVRQARDLSAAGWMASGWFDYEFAVAADGWYRLVVQGSGSGVEFILDPDAPSAPAQRFYGGSGRGEARDKIGNLWLAAGTHRLRLQRYYWSGFPRITAIELQPASESLADTMAARLPGDRRLFRPGACGNLEILAGGRARPTTLYVRHMDTVSGATHRVYEVAVPATARPERIAFPVPCAKEGFHSLWFAEPGRTIDNPEMRGIHYEVYDATPAARAPPPRPAAEALVDIDCAAQAPDYSGGGATRLATLAGGAYRESGDTGWTRWQRTPEAARRLLPEPSWFAYALPRVAAGVRYRIEVDYPDDALRTIAVALRESAPLAYPLAVGAETGGEHLRSHALQRFAFSATPRAAVPRLVFLSAHDGQRAACGRIRVFREEPAPAPAAPKGGRQFVNWYEEGLNFLSLYGPSEDSARGRGQAADRWLDGFAAVGGTLLMPSVVVYNFALYPSAYNRSFSAPDQDDLLRILMAAEKRGIAVAPEVHPRADELQTGFAPGVALPRVLLDREGRNNVFHADGRTRNHPPHFHPLHPTNRAWYEGMVGEIAERYRDQPALAGVAMRVMGWANPTLNNWASLDWGYDDLSVELFRRDTGLPVPMGRADDPKRYSARHQWLMANAKARWIAWRCEKIAEVLTRLRDRLRAVRPDLKLHVLLFGTGEAYAPAFAPGEGPALRERWRESGLDPEMLAKIDGVVVTHHAYGYGRREPDLADTGQRDPLLDGPTLRAAMAGGPGRFVSGAYYLEATDAVVPPERLGFPANTRRTWMSAVVNPSGRNALERYAVQLAETDAVILGDGGNGYTLGPPVVGEFIADYRRLPALPFADVPGAGDPVAVRARDHDGHYWFYAVNREPHAVRLDLRWSAGAKPVRLDGRAFALEGERLEVELPAFGLLAGKAGAGARILSATQALPAERFALAKLQGEWIARLAAGPSWRFMGGPDARERRLIDGAARAVAQALAAGRIWRVRAILDHSSLRGIYRKLGCEPPGLRDGSALAQRCGV